MSPAASASTNHARQGGVVGAGGGGGGSTDFTPAGVKRDSFSLVNLLHPEPPPPPPQPEHSQLASASLEDKIPLTNNNKKSSMQNMGVKIIHNLPTPTASPAPQPQPSSSSSSSSSSSTSLSAASSASSTISSSINVLNALVVCKEDLIGKDSILHHEPENDYMVIARDSEEQKDINNKNSIITTKCDGEDSMQKHKCRKCNVGFENASHLQQRNKEMHRFMTWECMYCHKKYDELRDLTVHNEESPCKQKATKAKDSNVNVKSAPPPPPPVVAAPVPTYKSVLKPSATFSSQTANTTTTTPIAVHQYRSILSSSGPSRIAQTVNSSPVTPASNSGCGGGGVIGYSSVIKNPPVSLHPLSSSNIGRFPSSVGAPHYRPHNSNSGSVPSHYSSTHHSYPPQQQQQQQHRPLSSSPANTSTSNRSTSSPSSSLPPQYIVRHSLSSNNPANISTNHLHTNNSNSNNIWQPQPRRYHPYESTAAASSSSSSSSSSASSSMRRPTSSNSISSNGIPISSVKANATPPRPIMYTPPPSAHNTPARSSSSANNTHGIGSSGNYPSSSSITIPTSTPQNYECHICHKRFNLSIHLAQHMRTHSLASMERFLCTYCGVTFGRKHDMLRHERGHMNEKGHKCSFCGKGFTRKDAVARHEAKNHPEEVEAAEKVAEAAKAAKAQTLPTTSRAIAPKANTALMKKMTSLSSSSLSSLSSSASTSTSSPLSTSSSTSTAGGDGQIDPSLLDIAKTLTSLI